MSNMDDKNSKQDDSSPSVHIGVEHVSAGGNVLFAGRDGNMSINTGGDVDQNTENTVIFAGVKASRNEYDQVVRLLRDLDAAIEEEELDRDTKEEAELERDNIKRQLLREDQPNPKILIRSAKRLLGMGTKIARAVLNIFSQPIVGKIVEGLGESAMSFLDTVMKSKNDDKK